MRTGRNHFSAIVEVSFGLIGWMQFADRLIHEIDSTGESEFAHQFDVIEMVSTFDAGYWSIFEARFGSHIVLRNTPMYFYKMNSQAYTGYMLALIGDHPWCSYNHRDISNFLATYKLEDRLWNEDGEDA